jgi:hypothetical protein
MADDDRLPDTEEHVLPPAPEPAFEPHDPHQGPLDDPDDVRWLSPDDPRWFDAQQRRERRGEP